VGVIILKDARKCQFSLHLKKKHYTDYRLSEMPPSQRKIVGSAKQNYRISPKLSQLAKFNFASLNIKKFEFTGS